MGAGWGYDYYHLLYCKLTYALIAIYELLS